MHTHRSESQQQQLSLDGPQGGPGTDLLAFTEATIGLGLIALLISYLPTIYGAFSRRELLVNLLDNAIKYTPAGGAVTLTVGGLPDKAVLEVVDNGMGIPPEALERIFERFYRTREARGKHARGSGIGLSLVKHIAEAHGGRVIVDSDPGHGATFTVTVPLRGNDQDEAT